MLRHGVNMAKIINQREDEELELDNNEEAENFEEPTQDTPEESTQAAEANNADEIPDKYKGKDLKDIVQMHQEAEKLLGRQSSEVGELRKIVDDFVKAQLVKEQAHESTTTWNDDLDFFDDPKKAVEHAIANHPKIKEAETVSLQLRQSQAKARLQTAHPDFEKIVTDSKFLEWVTKSKIRTDLLNRADKQFDFDSADELLTSWKERQNIVTEAQQNEDRSRKQQMKAASTGNTSGSSEAPSRKVYRRADIIKLMQTDPDRYQQLAPEIRQAYAEGRVR